MSSPAFHKTLESTGYLMPSGRPAPGLTVAGQDSPPHLQAVLGADKVGLAAGAVFSAHKHPVSIFKDCGTAPPTDNQIRGWHEAAWNACVAPLLWVVTPTDVHLYDCYRSPSAVPPQQSASTVALGKFPLDRLAGLDAACGRIATESRAFWSGPIGQHINRRHRVDRQLLDEIAAIEQRLVEATLAKSNVDSDSIARDFAQRLIGRCIFTWFLLDRNLAQPFLPDDLDHDLSAMFGSLDSAYRLFAWLSATFNGDHFPLDDPRSERAHLTDEHLEIIRSFVEGRSLIPGQHGQGRLFRFRFDAIPISLLSSIYQQFAQSGDAGRASAQGLHYTPVELVHFVLDAVFEGLPDGARVMDPACGSGAFLVEAFHRLAWRESDGGLPNRTAVRRILYEQLFGIDINPSALRVAAFSLYLAALDLEGGSPDDIKGLRFDRLIGRTLFRSDAARDPLPAPLRGKQFEVLVGNLPWTYAGRGAGSAHPQVQGNRPGRSRDHQLLRLAQDIAGASGRIGMIMKATPFFSADHAALAWRREVLTQLRPCALINLSQLRHEGLFPDVTGPAIIFFARCRLSCEPDQLLTGSNPWSPDFHRSGVIQVDPGEIRSVALKRVLAWPSVLKAATFGTARDERLLARMGRSFPTLKEVLDDLKIQYGRNSGAGFVVGCGDRPPSPKEYFDMPVLTNFTAFRLPQDQGAFGHGELECARRSSIFRGPLVLCPERVRTDPPDLRGRYCVATSSQDLLYTSSVFGISFACSDTSLVDVLSGILNSSLTTLQLTLGGPNLGLERPTVDPHSIRSLRVPRLKDSPAELLEAVGLAERRAALAPTDSARLAALDEAVFDLYDLETEERVLAAETVERTRHISCASRDEYERTLREPDRDDLRMYGGEVVQTINAYLEARGARHLEAVIYPDNAAGSPRSAGLTGVTALRFAVAQGGPPSEPVFRDGSLGELSELAAMLRGRLSVQPPPYLNESRQLRIYRPGSVMIVKPAQWRYWTRTAGLNDADKILADSWQSETAYVG